MWRDDDQDSLFHKTKKKKGTGEVIKARHSKIEYNFRKWWKKAQTKLVKRSFCCRVPMFKAALAVTLASTLIWNNGRIMNPVLMTSSVFKIFALHRGHTHTHTHTLKLELESRVRGHKQFFYGLRQPPDIGHHKLRTSDFIFSLI